MDTAKKYCRILLDTLLANGVKNVVISPGSRNAPLLLGINARKEFNVIPCTDERTAGFIALGMAMQQNCPVVLCCTSGTALYNYSPAVAEAFYQNIPLIIISADRPLQWIGQDDSQTLLQFDALNKIVKKSFEIPQDSSECKELEWYVNRITNEAVNLAKENIPGPVHINIRLDNPLSELIPFDSGAKIRTVTDIDAVSYDKELLKSFAKKLSGKKILIVAGFMLPNNKLNRVLQKFERLANVKILCETISNLHLKGNPYAIDRIFTVVDNSSNPASIFEELKADIIISFGGALISRKLKEFIRSYPPEELWTLSDTAPQTDCFKCLTSHFNLSPEKFFTGIYSPLVKSQNRDIPSHQINNYKKIWESLLKLSETKDLTFFSKTERWTELTVFKHIFETIPPTCNLFLSNGTVIRYAQLFTNRIPHASFGCRGVSGIEGTNAAALGTGIGYKGSTILITGDLSFSYDTGILAYKHLSPLFKIIVINNSGGGIFRFIPSTRNLECCEEIFCTHPVLPLEGLAKAYDWDYLLADDEKSLKLNFSKFLNSKNNTILELKFDPTQSASDLLDYFSYAIND